MTDGFRTIEDMVVATAEALRPPLRLTVAEAAAEFRYVNNPGVFVGKWDNNKAPYLVDPMNVTTSRDYTGMILVGPAQCGKALDIQTVIEVPGGTKTMGELRPGDWVFGPDGQPTQVFGTSAVMTGHRCLRVTFDDGESIVADEDHLWAVNDTWARDPYASTIKATRNMERTYRITTSKGTPRFRYSIPVAAPVERPDVRLPIDPYLLGVWLGDGRRDMGSLMLGSEDCPHITARLLSRLLVCRVHRGEGNAARTADRVTVDGLHSALRRAELLGEEKAIPPEYLRASIAQRRELMRGLMDTDGTVARGGRLQISSSYEGLAGGIRELAWSLGAKVHSDEKATFFSYKGERKRGRQSYRISFIVESPADFVTLPRHLAAVEKHERAVSKRPTHSGRRFIRAIEEVASVPVKCIRVDRPDGLFLVGRALIATHNTDIFFNMLGHRVICDPADIMLIHMTMVSARDFAIRRVERYYRDNPDIDQRILPGKHNRSHRTTKFSSGMLLSMSWPAITELSGRPIPFLWLTDYDRMTENVDGEGSPYALAKKRATTFRQRGMCVAESSPGWEIDDPRWTPKTKHEAPPTRGILSLYNAGDRRRWYWPCPHCNAAFEPRFELLQYDVKESDLLVAAEGAVMACPECGGIIHHYDHAGVPGKDALNRKGRWVRDGETWRPGLDGVGGVIIGTARRTDTASFWLNGAASAFVDWKTIVYNYLKAYDDFVRTGSQESLKATINADQGMPFMPRGSEISRLPEDLKAGTRSPLGVVPVGVRYLIAAIDIQKNKFVVQVHGLGRGGDIWVIDRFDVRTSARIDPESDKDKPQYFWVKPASHHEDWGLLIQAILTRGYPLENDVRKRSMSIRLVGCDTGGQEGVTANAYNFWRFLRDGPEEGEDEPPGWEEGLHRRLQLVRGTALPAAPRVQLIFPDSDRKDRRAGARGEVPVLQIQTNLLKDQLDAMLDRKTPGGGKITFAEKLPDSFFNELTVERRGLKGWENPKQLRNESWDLLCYTIALSLSRHIRAEQIDWDDPPEWAAEWDSNTLIYGDSAPRAFEGEKKTLDRRAVADALT